MMNERIKELAISNGIFDSLCDPFDELNNGDYYSSVMVDLERFGELIVRECIDYCGENLSKTVGGALKIHFGVEE